MTRHTSEQQDTVDELEHQTRYVPEIRPSDAKSRQSLFYVRFKEQISVPRFLAFHHSSEVLRGWFGFFLSSEYEVYHMRREIKGLEETTLDRSEEWERIIQRRWLFAHEGYRKRCPDYPHLRLKQDIEKPSNDATSSEASSSRDPPKAVEATQHVKDHPYEDPEEVKEIHECVEDQHYPPRSGRKMIACRVDPITRAIYYIYKSPVHKRQRILQYAAFIIGHLGVFAFLFQVFDDRGAIMQICCYFQLSVLLLCFFLYAFTYVMDFVIVQIIKKEAKIYESTERNRYDLKKDGVCQYVHCIFAVNDFDISNDQQREKMDKLDEVGAALDLSGNNSYIFPVLDLLFAVSTMMIECLTIAYIYNNTRGDDQGQGDKSQQTLTAISNVCKILGLG